MKKNLHLLLIATLISVAVKAQYVGISDSSLRYWLQQNYPGCMQGYLLDTTCTAVLNATSLTPNVDSNINGLQYFKSATYLLLNNVNGGNGVIHLTGSYPPGLTWFGITQSAVLNIPPAMPATLLHLSLFDIHLTSLSTLPANLKYLDVGDNFIAYPYMTPLTITVPAWPTTLDTLIIDDYDADGQAFPPLPEGMTYFSAYNASFTHIPKFPPSLYYLNIGTQQTFTWVDSLLPLPPDLTYLYCNGSTFLGDTMPVLPANLNTLFASNCGLIHSPVFPPALVELNISGNSIPSFNPFPAVLQSLTCSNNLNTSLPPIPAPVYYLECGGDSFKTLPDLPGGLFYLYCDGSLITSVPQLPYSITTVELAYDNLLTSLPSNLPPSLVSLEVSDDPLLTCLPPLPIYMDELDFTGTQISCLPNYTYVAYGSNPNVYTLHLCDANSGCPSNWNISGSVFFNNTGGCVHQSVEPLLQPVKLDLFRGDTLVQQMYSPGLYSFKTNLKSYTVEVDTNSVPFAFDCGFDSTVNIRAADSQQVVNFEGHCKDGFDLGVNSITTGYRAFFPADTTEVNISAGDVLQNRYGISCNTAGISGQVQITFTGPVKYAGVGTGVAAPASVSGDTVTWAISDFSQSNGWYSILLLTDSSANAHDVACIEVSITPTAGDNNPSNNNLEQCFAVHNSFDPNYKEVSPVSELPYPYSDWLTYTIHFQNTGTGAARNISITDTLDANVDPTSFQLLAYSYAPTVQITGNYVTFYFNQILLPDSTGNPQGSTGYVQYRVKPLANLSIGATISNTAYISFDFNSPVVTNSTTNTVSATAAIKNITASANISIYPNPSTGTWQLAVSNELLSSTLEVFDEQGRSVFHSAIGNQKSEIKFEAAPGVYYLRISNENVSVVRKLVKI